jgi:hypothetical protein
MSKTTGPYRHGASPSFIVSQAQPTQQPDHSQQSHKVLTASLGQMEHDGLVLPAVYPEVPPSVKAEAARHYIG